MTIDNDLRDCGRSVVHSISSLSKVVTPNCGAQLRRPFANIVEIDCLGEELMDITPLQLRVRFKRPDQLG